MSSNASQDMDSTGLPKANPDTLQISERLTPYEIKSLRMLIQQRIEILKAIFRSPASD